MYLQISSLMLSIGASLLLVSTLTVPVTNMYLIKATFDRGGGALNVARWGVFGACSDGACTARKLGYDIGFPAKGLVNAEVPAVLKSLSFLLICHPIAAGLGYFAAFIAGLSQRCGLFFASVITFIAAAAAQIAMGTDLGIYAGIHKAMVAIKAQSAMEGQSAGTVKLQYGAGVYCTIAGCVCLWIGWIACLVECCCGMAEKRNSRGKYERVELQNNIMVMPGSTVAPGVAATRGMDAHAYSDPHVYNGGGSPPAPRAMEFNAPPPPGGTLYETPAFETEKK